MADWTLNGEVVEIDDMEISGKDWHDYPDFCDAYIERAWLVDGRELTDDECYQLQNENACLFHERVTEW